MAATWGQLESWSLESIDGGAMGNMYTLVIPIEAKGGAIALKATKEHTLHPKWLALPLSQPPKRVGMPMPLAWCQHNRRPIDLVIIATQSDIRFKVLKNLTEQSHVINFMILEKVLFQNINEYDLSSEIIKNRQIKCWVNCTRRAFPIYQKIKSYLNDEISNLRFKVAGGEWGLMSNSIHFLDTISYITENSDIKITQISKLIDPINSISKRKNVYESSGKIEGICGDSNFVFISKKSSDDDLVFSVESNSMKIIINETQGLAKFTKSKHSYKETFVIPYLSQFSINIVENILLTSECGLPYLENSIALHKPLIQELSSYFKRNFDQDFCPLT